MFRMANCLKSRAFSASPGALHGCNLHRHLRLCVAGMVRRALDLMDAWVSDCTEPGLKGVTSNGQPAPVPRWIDALLLLVNSCTATIWEASLQKEEAADKSKAPEPQARCEHVVGHGSSCFDGVRPAVSCHLKIPQHHATSDNLGRSGCSGQETNMHCHACSRQPSRRTQ